MANSYVITRKVGNRTYYYLGQGKDGKPKYATSADCNRFFQRKNPQKYTRKDNAQRSALRLSRADEFNFWKDCRRQIGEFDIRPVKFYDFC